MKIAATILAVILIILLVLLVIGGIVFDVIRKRG